MKPLTIEELKALPKCEYVYIVNKVYGFGTYERKPINANDKYFIHHSYTEDDRYAYSDYGDKWVAYKNKEQVETSQGEREYLIEQARKEIVKEIFSELIKSTALCESQGGHCSLDYLILKARQRGLEYVGLDKDGNAIWVGDIITREENITKAD